MVADLKTRGSASRVTESDGTRIVSKDVQPAIVRVRFLLQVVPHVMFGDEMTRQRVQAASPKAGHNEIKQYMRSARNEGDDRKIEG